ncbi:MAG: 6-phosphofructokinase [Candidatus Bipolaricaulota bacterium]|nr:6-phosphofructokinase [Candidatus Bipolaricaulota bacterium]
MPTFGFKTVRHMGTKLVRNLIEDAHTKSRWHFVAMMGRRASYLALGNGKAAGATLTGVFETSRST